MPTPTWNNFPDFATTEMIDAADLNTYSSNNQLFLYRKGHRQASGGFPASPASGDRCYRTDRGIQYYWDGTRWASVAELGAQLTPQISVTVTTTLRTQVLPMVYAPYYTAITTSVNISVTNDVANHWVITVAALNAAQSSSTNVLQFNTQGYVVGGYAVQNWLNSGGLFINNPAPGTMPVLQISANRFGNPGTLIVTAHAHYRLVG